MVLVRVLLYALACCPLPACELDKVGFMTEKDAGEEVYAQIAGPDGGFEVGWSSDRPVSGSQMPQHLMHGLRRQ